MTLIVYELHEYYLFVFLIFLLHNQGHQNIILVLAKAFEGKTNSMSKNKPLQGRICGLYLL
jgi:hypothetical protein